MKTEIKYTDDYILLVDLKAEIDRLSYVIGDGVGYTQGVVNEVTQILDDERVIVNTTTALNKKGLIKVIAYKKLNQEAPDLDLPLLLEFGYKSAQSKGTFTLEDMEKAIELARLMCDDEDDNLETEDISGLTELCTYSLKDKYSKEEIIQQIQQSKLPKGFEPEFEYYYHSSKEFYSDARFVKCSKEQYNTIKEEIPTCPLKIKLKTTTNSENKEVVVGKWIY